MEDDPKVAFNIKSNHLSTYFMIIIIAQHPKLTEPVSTSRLPNSWDFAKGPFEVRVNRAEHPAASLLCSFLPAGPRSHPHYKGPGTARISTAHPLAGYARTLTTISLKLHVPLSREL